MSRGARAAHVEIARHDWARHRAPRPDGGSEVAAVLRRMFDPTTPTTGASCSLESLVEVQCMVFEVALPTIDVILAGYDDELPGWVESEFLNVLHAVLLGEPHRSEVALGNHDLVERCVQRARAGTLVLYRALRRHSADWLLDVLDVVDDDRDRFRAFRAQARRDGWLTGR